MSVDERAPFSGVEVSGSRIVLHNEWYDSEIEAELSADGERMSGRWRKTQASEDSVLPFVAYRDDARRFLPTPSESAVAADATVDGVWTAAFEDEDGGFPAEGIFHQSGARVTGTFRTTTGDYRYLEGDFDGALLRLSTFDGAHAFLFRAQLTAEGTLAGDFWSRDSYHATWTAHRADPGAAFTDPFERVGITDPDGRLDFAFRDLDGRLIRSDDSRFRGKVVVVDLFGSWCPNCNDSAPLLVDWAERYRERGLELVGLAFEMTGDPERDRRFVRRYGERHGIGFPLLLAGTSDKAAASALLPALSAVLAFPTKVFVDRSGKVRRVYSGFDGPSTGGSHADMVAELERLLDLLLDEPAAGS